MKFAFEIAQVSVTSLLSLVVLFALTRLGGKRQISQMSLFDYANSITIGSIAAELATDLENWYRSLTALLIYGIFAYAVHILSYRSLKFRTLLNGRTIVLMENGTISKSALQKSSIDLNEFAAQARVAGYYDLNEIQCACLETNGQISFLPRSQNRPVCAQDIKLPTQEASNWTQLILDGKLLQANLKQCGKEQSWLMNQLHHYNVTKISDVFYAACDESGGFYLSKIK